MKRILFCLFLLVSVAASAQTMQEVVYLKNGSVIRGIVIEQVPNESLKIQTADGSVFAYQMDEVEKITKEAVDNTRRSSNVRNASSNSHGFGGKGTGLKSGYRGFVDFGGGVGVGDWGDGRVGFSTSHGYQFCPYFFLGVGVGLNYHTDWDVVEIPIFAHLRSEFLDNAISPFLDVKIGYSPYDGTGVYAEPSVGCRVGVTDKLGLSLGIGYEMQSLEIGWGKYSDRKVCGAVSFKLALDF